MRITLISDTHEMHNQVDVGSGDMIIHCGDFTMRGDINKTKDFLDWYCNLDFKHKILVAGNHDFSFYHCMFDMNDYCKELNINYLEDNLIDIEGIKIYGTPWTPICGRWAFMLDDDQLHSKFNRIPNNIDILVSHGPQYGMMDWVGKNEDYRVGSIALMEKITELYNLKLHVFGHIHEAYGSNLYHDCEYINCSICNENYEPINKPIVIEWEI